MIWLTWRQFRAQAVVIYGAIVILAVALAATGPHLAHLYHLKGNGFLNDINGIDTALYVLSCLALLTAPALIGMFWGAPLVTRELDAGTHRRQGHRPPVPAGWPPSSASSAWPPWPPPDCSASR